MAGHETDGPLIPRRIQMIGTFALMVLAVPAMAQENTACETLRSQLHQQPRQIVGNTAEVRRFANALAQQNILIRRIKNDLRGYGCTSGSITVYGNPNAELCGEIGDALEQAEADRDMIAQDRDRMLADRRSENRQDARDRILAALNAQGCYDEQPSDSTTDPSENPDMQEPIGGYGAADNQDYAPTPDMPMQRGLRTLCVRTCDGAFFPISSDATPLDFKEQAAQCERMCPGTQTELFYHELQGQESADMVSARTGQPYASMPNAFAYRNSPTATRAPSCSCNMTAYGDQMKAQDGKENGPQSTPSKGSASITTIPSPKGDTARKPAETKPVEKAEPIPERDYDPSKNKVRIVGPQFMQEETSRIDLKNPALQGAQPQQQ